MGLIVLATKVDLLLKLFQERFKFLFREDDEVIQDEFEMNISSSIAPDNPVRIDVAAGVVIEPGAGIDSTEEKENK